MGRYVLATRRQVYSLLFLLPLLVTYEIMAMAINFESPMQIRNGADIIVRSGLQFLGIRSMFGFMMTVVLVTIVLALHAYREDRERIRFELFGYMLAESVFYAFALGVAASKMAGLLLVVPSPLAGGAPGDTWVTRLMISLGAGVYEEIVFRVFLIFGLMGLFGWLFGDQKGRTVAAAVFVAAAIFSAFHYVGPLGEVFVWSTFLFRFMAGLLLSALYVARGLGVTAWSHSLYDVFLMFGLV